MSQVFVVGAERKSFDGAVVLMLDDGVLGTVYALPCETATLEIVDSNAYPALIDDTAIPVNKVAGVRLGHFDAVGFVKNDHFTAASGHDLITQAFGPRTGGQLSPWILALIPYSGATPIVACGLWLSKMSLTGQVSGAGTGSAWRFRIRAEAADPGNSYGATAPTLPSYSGTLGTGISSMASSSFTNGAPTSPTVYDAVRAIRFDLDNQLGMIAAMKAPAQRLCAGFLPGPLRGAVSLTQLGGASTPAPGATGDYPFDIAIPDGSGGKTLTLATSLSWDSSASDASTREFWSVDSVFSLYGVNAGNATGTASVPWPVVVTYA